MTRACGRVVTQDWSSHAERNFWTAGHHHKAVARNATSQVSSSRTVEFPLGLAGRVDRKYLILIGLLMFGGQFVVLLGPELAFVYALDLSLYGEAVIATTLATAAVRVRYVWQKIKSFRRSAE